MTDAATDDLDRTHVVTVFLRNRADVLLLRRSEEVGSYEGKWGTVAGHAGGSPDDAAGEEIREETGIDPAARTTLVRRGDTFEVTDAALGTRWVVHPYLFDCETRAVEPNYETAEFEWAPPTEILRRDTIPDLWTSYDRVRPTPATITDDTAHGSAYLSVRALEALRDEAAIAARYGGDRDALETVARALVAARPAMTVVVTRVDRVVAETDEHTPATLERAATDGIERALAADEEAAAVAADRLPDRVATLSRSGTALDAIERAAPDRVLVAESRPGREGVEAAERLADRTDADVTLTTDAAFPDRAVANADALVVGADSVRPDGRVVNKVGTRAAATVASHEGIDVLVAAASDKLGAADERRGASGENSDWEDADDAGIDREERDPAEVYDGDGDLRATNPTFDVTPAACVASVVTERGALDADDVRAVAEEHRAWADWRR